MCKNPILFFFALLVCSEFGDRSQLSAILIAVNYNPWIVILGGCIAHILCILIAMLLGKIIERFCKERLINILGGIAFIAFGFWELFAGIIYADRLEN
jgi:putative Ca2+/H+ antiporter (TMEM165/GDT1 family)